MGSSSSSSPSGHSSAVTSSETAEPGAPEGDAVVSRVRGRGALLAIIAVQLLLGAWVAGMDAGYIASDWPLMNGRFFPAGVDWSHGLLYAVSNDPFLVYFLHRWWAFVALAAVIMLARGARRGAGRPLPGLHRRRGAVRRLAAVASCRCAHVETA